MIAQPILTKTQKHCLIFTLALTLTLAWTTLARADSPGDLDTTFGGTGIVTTSISSGADGGFSVAIQPDGKIVVAGASDNIVSKIAVVRYNSDGSQDTTFNSTGVVTTPTNNASWGFATALQPDGKIVVAGVSGYDFGVVRYTSDGNLDTGFNGTGIVTTSIGSDFDIGRSVTLQSDGKIVVAGETVAANCIDNHFAVVRYTISGTRDIDFNGTGIVTTSLVNGRGLDVAILQMDDKIVVGGDSNIVRYTTTGVLDTSFNTTGIVTTPGLIINSLELQTDGKIVVAGSRGGDFAVARYNSDGSPDTTFNGTGIVTTPITSDGDGGLSVAIQPNRKIVVAGSSGHITGNEGDMAVVRYNSDGSLDTTFGNTGIVTTSVSSTRDDAWDVAIQSDGKIVVAGFSNDGTNDVSFAVVRYIGDRYAYLPVVLKN